MRERLPWLVAMVAMVTCRVQEPEPPVSAAEEPRGTVEAEAPKRSPPPAPLEPEPSPLEPLPEPPAEPQPPPALVAIVTPFSPAALVLSPVTDGSPVVLFPDERAALRRRVGQVLADQRVELVPVAEIERIEAAAAEGRLVLEGDQRCRSPLTPAEVASRYFPGRPTLEAGAACYEDCGWLVTVHDPPHYADPRSWESPKVSRPYDPKAWLAAAGRLRATQSFGFGGLGLFGTSHAPPVRFNPPVGIGPWTFGHPEEAPFSALEGSVAGCAHPDPIVGFSWSLRASVDRKGRVTRCTAESDHSLAIGESGGTCICAAVETIRFPAGKAGRRFRVEAVDDGGFARNARFELVQPGTETWVTRLQEAPASSRCIDANPQPTALTARVILSLAPDGAVEGVRIEGDITTPASIGLASCLVQELRLVPLPCRPPGVDALHVSLIVGGP